jgi:hypothetical protein
MIAMDYLNKCEETVIAAKLPFFIEKNLRSLLHSEWKKFKKTLAFFGEPPKSFMLNQGKNDERSVATGDAQNDEAGNKKSLIEAANNLINVYENSKWIAPDEVNEAILELSKYILK